MKTTIVLFSNRLFRVGLLMLAVFFAALPARAGLSMVMELAHEVNNGFPPFSQTNYQMLLYDVQVDGSAPAAPSGAYVISSPGGAINETFNLTNTVISNVGGNSSAVFLDYASFIQEMTTGRWFIAISSGGFTNKYFFTISAGSFTSNSLPTVNITFPTPGATNITNSPTFTWDAVSWGSGNIQVTDRHTPTGFSTAGVLATSQSSWPSPALIPDGVNSLDVTYAGSLSPSIFTASTPTNYSSQSIGFTFQSTLVSYAITSFTVANHAPGHPSSTPLVAHYTFNDGNLAATDVSGNGNTLSGYYNDSEGSITITNDALEGAYAAAFAAQFTFSGGSYFTENTNLLSALAGSFSVSLWLKTTEVSGSDTDAGIFSDSGIVSAFAADNANGTNYVIPMVLTGHKVAFVTVGGGGSVRDTLHSATSVNTGEYVHVVVTRNQVTGEKKIYVNGELDAVDTGTTDLLNGSSFLEIGINNGQGFTGELDDIQFYSTVLSDSDVLQLYENPGTTTIIDLSTALDATNLTWTTSGDTSWFGENTNSFDEVSAAQSGIVTGSQTSVLSTTVTGPGTLTFWWATSASDSNFDLQFAVDGGDVDDNNIFNDGEWSQEPEVSIPAGQHTLTWTARANGSTDPNNAGWLDEVQYTAQAIQPPGHVLLAYYSFDDGNLAASDFSGLHNDLSFPFSYGGASANLTTDAKAGTDAVLFLNNGGAGSAYYYTPNATLLSALTGSFSVSAWINTSQISGSDTDDGIYSNAGIMSAFNDPGTNFVIPMSITGHKLAFVTAGSGGTVQGTLRSAASIDTAQYVHVVVTRDQVTGEKKIYVNGNLDASETGTTDVLTGPVQLSIGVNNGNGYNGEMDDIQIYSGVLSGSEVSQLYNNPGTTVTNTGIAPPAPVSLHFSLQIERYQDLNNHSSYYDAAPYIDFVSPIPVTTNMVVSPDGHTFSEVWAGDSSQDNEDAKTFPSLDELISACTNGLWKVYINKGDPSEQVFRFRVSIAGLTTNILSPVVIFTPTNGAVNVPTNSPFQWLGPASFSSIFVEAYQELPSFVFDGYQSLPGNATNWPSPPALLYGTNNFYIAYTSNSFPGVIFTTPVDAGLNTVSDWNAFADLDSYLFESFVVGAPGPLPVQLGASPPQSSGGNFQLSFQTVAGRPETIQMRTNLMVGTWTDVTNFIGDGSVHQFTLPTTNAPGEYFRVLTQ